MAAPPHGRVPPRPFSERAATEARVQLAAAPPEAREPVAWLAGCLDDPSPAVRERIVAGGEDDPTPLTVEATARYVDHGRLLAAAAAGDGITVLVAAGAPTAGTERVAQWVADGDTAHPLGALRRLGDARAARLAGLALGAGEQGLALVCDGPAAAACAALAVAIEPGLRPRVLAADADGAAVVAVLRAASGV
jgi:hypothetical protein